MVTPASRRKKTVDVNVMAIVAMDAPNHARPIHSALGTTRTDPVTIKLPDKSAVPLIHARLLKYDCDKLVLSNCVKIFYIFTTLI